MTEQKQPAMSTAIQIVDTSKYQLMPDMSPGEFEALKADIAERGVVVPIDIDETGEILDGHNRYRAWIELKKNEPPPTIVREGLSEREKRAFARKNNILRRHLTREQIRRLVAEQLKDSPEWADNRIAEVLGVDGKTVGAVRDDLESTSEIPKLDRLVGKDGKARKRPRRRNPTLPADEDEDDNADLRPRKRRKDEWDEWAGGAEKRAKMMHAVDIIGMGADPNSEKVQKLLREAAAFTFKSPPGTYDPLAGRSEDEAREWHVFMLFLVQRCRYSPLGASGHVEWVLQRPFQNVTEWFGEEGDKWRKSQRMRPIPGAVKESWRAFLVEQTGRSQAEIVAELENLEREWAARPSTAATLPGAKSERLHASIHADPNSDMTNEARHD